MAPYISRIGFYGDGGARARTRSLHLARGHGGHEGGQQAKDDPADVATQGFDAMLAGKDHVIPGSLKVKARAAMAQVTPETIKAEQHRKDGEPGSGTQ